MDKLVTLNMGDGCVDVVIEYDVVKRDGKLCIDYLSLSSPTKYLTLSPAHIRELVAVAQTWIADHCLDLIQDYEDSFIKEPSL